MPDCVCQKVESGARRAAGGSPPGVLTQWYPRPTLRKKWRQVFNSCQRNTKGFKYEITE